MIAWAVALAVPFFMFYAAALDKADIDVFLSVSFDRALLPAAVLGLASALVHAAGAVGDT